jgi:hypothetical protein
MSDHRSRPLHDVSNSLLVSPGIRRRIGMIAATLKQSLCKANSFKKESSISTMPNVEQMAIRSTRLYLALLIISMVILTLFTGLSEVTVSRTLSKPSVEIFEQLHATYPKKLFCPCQKLSVSYSSFISLVPTYHQVSHIELLHDLD